MKMARTNRRTRQKRLTKKDKERQALHALESNAKQALRRLHELRVRELLSQLERILKRLQHASKLDQSQLRALTRRGLAAINNFERQAGRPPLRTRLAEVGEEEGGGGARGNGSCEAQCAADL